MRVMGCVTRKPRCKHQRNSFVLRIGKRKPGPANVWAAPMRAWSSLLLSPTACPKKPRVVA